MGGNFLENMFPNNNPLMTYRDAQMPINQINPRDLDPQALYAYNQMMAALQSGHGSNPQLLDPQSMARQNALMQLYFPQMRKFY